MDYCKFDDCPYHGCENHPIAMPEGEKVTEDGLDRLRNECEEFRAREDDEARAKADAEIQKEIRNMTYGKALAILRDLGKPDTPDVLKGAAIRKVILEMETHNAVTKGVMVNVIRYLFNLCFEETEG